MAANGNFSDAYRNAWLRRAQVERPSSLRPHWTPRRLARMLGMVAFGFAVAIAAAVTVPLAFGLQSLTVVSGSMEPAISAGDIVVANPIEPVDARVRDVITFRSPDDAAKIITHRVESIAIVGETVHFVTRGDANTGVERWSVPASGSIGRVEYHIPKLGYVTNWAGSTFGRFAFLVVPAILLGVLELRRIWRREESAS